MPHVVEKITTNKSPETPQYPQMKDGINKYFEKTFETQIADLSKLENATGFHPSTDEKAFREKVVNGGIFAEMEIKKKYLKPVLGGILTGKIEGPKPIGKIARYEKGSKEILEGVDNNIFGSIVASTLELQVEVLNVEALEDCLGEMKKEQKSIGGSLDVSRFSNRFPEVSKLIDPTKLNDILTTEGSVRKEKDQRAEFKSYISEKKSDLSNSAKESLRNLHKVLKGLQEAEEVFNPNNPNRDALIFKMAGLKPDVGLKNWRGKLTPEGELVEKIREDRLISKIHKSLETYLTVELPAYAENVKNCLNDKAFEKKEGKKLEKTLDALKSAKEDYNEKYNIVSPDAITYGSGRSPIEEFRRRYSLGGQGVFAGAPVDSSSTPSRLY